MTSNTRQRLHSRRAAKTIISNSRLCISQCTRSGRAERFQGRAIQRSPNNPVVHADEAVLEKCEFALEDLQTRYAPDGSSRIDGQQDCNDCDIGALPALRAVGRKCGV
jgi:hypothetical protein